MADLSVVYVLTNPAMPGLVKIGMSAQSNTGERLAQLYTTGVPVPFELQFACRVTNPEQVESALHIAFGPQRINPRREFFRIDPEQAIAILRLLHTEETTNEVAAEPTGIDDVSIAAAMKFAKSTGITGCWTDDGAETRCGNILRRWHLRAWNCSRSCC